MFRQLALNAVCLVGLIGAALFLLPGPAQAQTNDSPYLYSLNVANGTVGIQSFHYTSSATNQMDVEICRVTDTGALDETNCATSSFTLSSGNSQSFDISNNSNWPPGGGGSGSRKFRARTLTTTSASSYYSPWSNTWLWRASGYDCTETNHPPTDLGTLGLSAGSTLTHTGEVEGNYYQAPCKSSLNSASNYFRFTIATGEAGAIKIEAPKGQSTMIAELLLRSGDSYDGTVLWQDNYFSHRDDALAAGLVAAGTYTLQLGSNTGISATNSPGAGGPYNLTITRLRPTLVSVTQAPIYIDTVWNVGAAVHASRYGSTANAIALPIKVDYQEITANSWTSVSTSLSPPNTTSAADIRVTGLTLGSFYRVRAAYTNATHYTESDDLETKAFIRVSASPYRVEAVSELIEESQARHRVRVAWETPKIEADANLTYRYATRLNRKATQFNPTGQEEILEAIFDWRAPQGGVLEIEVNNTFLCPSGGSWTECELTYDGRDHTIPAGEAWSTPWSAPAVLMFPAPSVLAAGSLSPPEPDPSVAGAINLGFDVAGSPKEGRPVNALAGAIGGILCLAIGSAIGYWAQGPKVARVSLGAGIFFVLFAGIGTTFFAIPRELVMVLAATSIVLASVFLIRRFSL